MSPIGPPALVVAPMAGFVLYLVFWNETGQNFVLRTHLGFCQGPDLGESLPLPHGALAVSQNSPALFTRKAGSLFL